MPDRDNHRKWALYFGFIFCVFIFLFTNLVPQWGAWYSTDQNLRAQTDAILQGHVWLSKNPHDMKWDYAWGAGGIEQIWGLGVPLWRLPFELCASAIGKAAFPDRLAFGVAILLVSYFTIRNLLLFSATYSGTLWPCVGVFTTILFPPFLALCCTRFFVYEEVAAYGFALGILLFMWTLSLRIRPRPASFFALALVSGLAPLFRPTIGIYGLASVIIGSILYFRRQRGLRTIGLALILYVSALCVLLLSNRTRFGNAKEFGHSLAINGLTTMAYAARFGSPYRHERFLPASKELYGVLFTGKSSLPPTDVTPLSFPGLSKTFRWRELYFVTYDWTYLGMLSVVYFWLGWRAILRMRGCERLSELSIFEMAAAWSGFAAIALAAFYLRFPFISSRYLMDFAPAFGIGVWVFWLLLLRFASSFPLKISPTHLSLALLVLALGWWGYEMTGTGQPPPRRAVSWDELNLIGANGLGARYYAFPSAYTNGFDFNTLGIPLNGVGWSSKYKAAGACVSVFVENPQSLVLDVVPADGQPLPVAVYDAIRANIGLESLRKKSTTAMPDGFRIVFYGPASQELRNGIQLASLAMVKTETLKSGRSKFKILQLKWSENVDDDPH